MKATVQGQILHRIQKFGPGSVFTPQDFYDLGKRAAIDQTLFRLYKRGVIRRLDRGIYDYPRSGRRVQYLSPDADLVAQKLAAKWNARIQRSGAHAANALGLSTQVPARPVYLTDGPSRVVRAGSRTIVFKKVGPRQLAGAGTISGDVYQALRYIGKKNVDDTVIVTLRRKLSQQDKLQLARDARYFPAWIQDVIKRIMEDVDAE